MAARIKVPADGGREPRRSTRDRMPSSAKLGKRRCPTGTSASEAVAMRVVERALIVVLVIAGLYFVLFHRDPMPLNHESVGLGNLHFVHDIIGVVLIGIA